jgi:MFS family permease
MMEPDFIFIAASLFTWGIGEGLFYYFIPLSLQQWQADPLLIGAIFGGVGIAIAIAQIPAGYISDRIGPRYIMWTSWIIGTIATWIMALARSLTIFVIGLWLYYLTAFVMAPMNNLIMMVRGRMRTERALTLIGGIFNLGAIAGPFIGGVLAKRFGLNRIYFFSACIFILSTIIIFFIRSRKVEHTKEEVGDIHLLKNRRYLAFLAISFFTVMMLYLPQPLTPNYLQNLKSLSVDTIGLFGTIGNIGNAFATLVLGSLSATTGLLVGQVMVILFSLAMWHGIHTWVFGLGYFLLGGYRLVRAMMVSITRSFLRARQVGLAFGILESVTGSAIIIAPLMAGWLYATAPSSIYPISMLFLIITVIANLIFLRNVHLKMKLAGIER